MPPLPRAVLLLGLILLNLPALAAASAAAEPLLIEADIVEIDLDRQSTQARGGARLSYGDLSLRADELTAERATGEVEASGGLELVQAGRRLQGESLQYSFRTEEGTLSKARAAEQGVIIEGAEITFSPTEVIAHEARFTTCDRQHPHYAFEADRISLTAGETGPGQRPRSGRLTLDRARVTYHSRALFTLPRYSVLVGDLGKPSGTPFPVTGFSRDDGPYASISYTLGEPDRPTLADLGYRYTTFRGIRGHVRLRQAVGPLELIGRYVRREDSSDRQLLADGLEASLANVLVNRAPEYGVRLPELAIGRSLQMSAEWLRGDYSERLPYEEEARAKADRDSATVLLEITPYAPLPGLTLSHALGWRRASYSSGDRFTARFFRHSADLDLGRDVQFSLSHIARRASGETPFLFDGLGPSRELLVELRWRVNPQWKLHLVDLYDLEERGPRDIIFEATRTAHCLEYTAGWRKQRGSFYLGIGLAPPSATGGES